jgi:diguanylate cyclase (GGDEF)-like protein
MADISGDQHHDPYDGPGGEVWEGSTTREQRATARDHSADVRDRDAESRDELARGRDVAARARDLVADGSAPLPGTSDRTMASGDRDGSVFDRVGAANDRQAALEDRYAAASDRAAASLDELTGAHRRGAGFLEFGREMARAHGTGQGLVLGFVDVNGLKVINDTLGHAAGDKVLREVVLAMRANLRSYDLIIRFGGDEFLCAIPGVTLAEAADRLGAVNSSLSAGAEQASISVGLAEMRADDSVLDLIGRADAALYRQRGPRTRLPRPTPH